MSQALRRRTIPSQRMIYLRCAACSYIIEEQVPGIGSSLFYFKLCPNCNTESKFAPFPDEFSSAWELAEIINHFYLRGAELIREAQEDLVRQMLECSGVECNIQDLEAAAWEIRTYWMDDDQWYSLLQQRFGLSSYEDAVSVLSLLQSYSTMPDEYIAIVILTSTLFEVLFAEMVYWLARRKGTTPLEAQARLDDRKRKNNGKRKNDSKLTLRHYEELFKELTDDGLTFREACSRAGLSKFWEERKYLREQRNQLLHAGSGSIDEDCAYRAYKFAQCSFQAFTKLHNSYALIRLEDQ